MIIQHNMPAINAHRNMGINTNNISKSLEKLSSGFRINRAADDAAGLAISEKMRGQISGINQASRNAQDGISLIQTAEGNLNETHAILNRMRELSVQSANGTYDNSTDRFNIDKEVQALKSEIDRIASSAEFNGRKLLDGSMSGEEIPGNGVLKDGDKVTPGAKITQFATAEEAAKLKDNGVEVSGEVTITFAAGAATNIPTATWTGDKAITISINSGSDGTKFTAKALNDAISNAADPQNNTGDAVIKFTKDFITSNSNGDIGAPGETAFKNTDTIATATLVAENTVVDATLIEKVTGNPNATQIDATDPIGKLVLQIGANGVEDQRVGLEVQDMSSKGLTHKNADGTTTSINDISASTRVAANNAIDVIDTAINTVSSTRADLGALQNRLEHTINNLGVYGENLTASESRIRDVDMAKEMMSFTKNQILQQASQAMLAQANGLPQGVLQLLQ